jgi:hypothetical protein
MYPTQPAIYAMKPGTTSAENDVVLVASYRDYTQAETALRQLCADGLSLTQLSLIGRAFEVPDAPIEDTLLVEGRQPNWFGFLLGQPVPMSVFTLFPIGGVLVMGPLANKSIAALDRVLQYRENLQAGEFLVVLQSNGEGTFRNSGPL